MGAISQMFGSIPLLQWRVATGRHSPYQITFRTFGDEL